MRNFPSVTHAQFTISRLRCSNRKPKRRHSLFVLSAISSYPPGFMWCAIHKTKKKKKNNNDG